MKKLALVALACTFGVGALSGCGSPCEKAFDKYTKCMEEKGADADRIKRFKEKKSKFVEECKKEGDKGKVKECLDKPCKEFRRCLKKATK